MNSVKRNRKGVKRKKSGSPTFDGFENEVQALPKKKSVSSALPSDKGWDRCKSGFGEDLIKEELISNSPWKVKDRRASKARSSSRSVKFTPQAVSDIQLEGSEEEEYIEEEPDDVDIKNWSSSEESNNNISDVELLVCDASPAPKGEQSEQIIKSAPTHSATSRGKKPTRSGQWMRNITSHDIEDEIHDARDEASNHGNRKQEASNQVGELVSQASTSKTDTNIDDYESTEEPQDASPSPSIGSEPSQNTGSAQISELSQSPTEDLLTTSTDTADTGTQITGTQWMKRFIQPIDSPDKVDRVDVGLVGAAGDSARKKNKFIKSGLADRMQKIMNREKSSAAFWNHQLTDAKKQPQSSSASLTVEVQSMEHLQGLYITRCNQLNSNQQLTSEHEKAGNKDQETPEEVADDGTQQLYVLFSHSTGQNLKIAVGLKIQIYPPWQKLTLPNYSEPVILSTYFCQVLGNEGSSQLTDDDSTQGDMASTSTGTFSPVKKPFQPLKLFESISSRSFTHITASGSLLQSVVASPDVKKVVSDSILDCIAESGSYSMSGMCVRARVQRVYCKRINSPVSQGVRSLGTSRHHVPPSHNLQWIMLVQDRHGVFCEVQLPSDVADRSKWRGYIQDGEGKVLVFSGIKVVHRTNRTRSPGLFSLIDSVTSPDDMETDQQFPSQSGSDSLEDPNVRNTHRARGEQNFCYTLGFQLGQGLVEEDNTQGKDQISYKSSNVCSLNDVIKEESPNHRVSFYAMILHACTETNTELPGHPASETTSNHNTGWHVIISDNSLQRSKDRSRDDEGQKRTDLERGGDGGSGAECAYVHVRSSCVVTGGGMAVIGQYGSLVLCKDICVQQGGVLYADIYSAILKLDNNCQGCDRITGCYQPQDGDIVTILSSVTMPTLAQLANNSTQHSLVSVTGKIRGVDESTAFSWPVCSTCGNEKLQGDESGIQLKCSECNLPVTKPVMKMHLEVFVECEASNESTTVKIKLLQSTIQSILPPLDEQDEGYDMQCIMGKTLQQIRCFIANVTVLPSGERCMALEEISVGDK